MAHFFDILDIVGEQCAGVWGLMRRRMPMDADAITDRIVGSVAEGKQVVALESGVAGAAYGLISPVVRFVANNGKVNKEVTLQLHMVSEMLGRVDRKLGAEAKKLADESEDIQEELQRISNRMIPAFDRKLRKLAGALNRMASQRGASSKKIAAQYVRDRHAASGHIFAVKDDVEFVYAPFAQFLQIGMGGEWWSGKVKPGKNVFHHRKERVDPAYRPVEVSVDVDSRGMRFYVTGGFGYEVVMHLVVK